MTAERRLSRRSIVLVIVALVFSIFHHADHVLRADHSGWPFTANVNEFTGSLSAYAVVAFVLLVRGRLWVKFWLMVVAYIATQAAHIFVETPVDQYTTWALNASQDPAVLGQPNLLNIASPLLGMLAVAVSILLSVFIVAATVSIFWDIRTQPLRKQARVTANG